MDTQIPLGLVRPDQPGELALGETAPVVSSCAGCGASLTVDKIHVLEDGEHVCCHQPECEIRYMKFKKSGELY